MTKKCFHILAFFFDVIATLVACFAAGHRKIYLHELLKQTGAIIRILIGLPWHTIFYEWDVRIEQLGCNGLKTE